MVRRNTTPLDMVNSILASEDEITAGDLKTILELVLAKGTYKVGDEVFVDHLDKPGYIAYVIRAGEVIGFKEALRLVKEEKI